MLLGFALAMDAFAVAVCNGLCYRQLRLRGALAIGLCFGLFQGIMPLLGYLLGVRFSTYITALDHWIALCLLGFLGGRMLLDASRGGEDLPTAEALTAGGLLTQGLATSIDALAVGISLAALADGTVWTAASVICAVTFSVSLAGVYIGKNFGTFLNRRAQLLGGLILIAIGIKICAEHLLTTA